MGTLNEVRDGLQESLANLIDQQENAVKARYIAVKIGVDLDDEDHFADVVDFITKQLGRKYAPKESCREIVDSYKFWSTFEEEDDTAQVVNEQFDYVDVLVTDGDESFLVTGINTSEMFQECSVGLALVVDADSPLYNCSQAEVVEHHECCSYATEILSQMDDEALKAAKRAAKRYI